MPKKTHNKSHHKSLTQHAFGHFSKSQFLAALSGESDVRENPLQANRGRSKQIATTHALKDSQKRRRDGVTSEQILPDPKRPRKSQLARASASKSAAASTETNGSSRPNNHDTRDVVMHPKTVANNVSLSRPSMQAAQPKSGISRGVPSQATPTIISQHTNVLSGPPNLPTKLQQSVAPKLFRSSRDAGLNSRLRARTTTTLVPSSLRQSDRYHTSGNTSGGEGGSSGEEPQFDQRTRFTLARSPYIQKVERPPVKTFIPAQHKSRMVFQSRAKRQVSERTEEDIKIRGGMLISSEKEAIAAHCTAHQQRHGINDHDFAEFIQSRSSECRKFLVTVHELIPYRRRKTVFDYMRRSFHNFKPRGQWTKAEDEKLSEAVVRLGRKWMLISLEMNRHNEDCAERYKNYHHVKDQRLTMWDDAETALLRNTVGSILLSAVKHGTEELPQNDTRVDEQTGLTEWVITESAASRMVVWQTIADHVPQRSRLQCYMRWGLLRRNGVSSFVWELARAMKREGFTQQIVNGIHILPQGKAMDAPSGIRIHARDDAQNLGKIVGRKKIKEMYGGDKLCLIQLIRESRVKQDEDIEWDNIRREGTGLEKFADMMLAAEWNDTKAKYEAAKGRSLQGLKTYKAARKVRKWLKRTMTETDKSRRQFALKPRRDEPQDQNTRSPKKSYKSSEYVDDTDQIESEL